jgi:3-isopropylmalate dehydratase small subunit
VGWLVKRTKTGAKKINTEAIIPHPFLYSQNKSRVGVEVLTLNAIITVDYGTRK